MANAKTNPLNSRVSSTTTNNFRLPPHPRLKEHVTQHGFSAGLAEWDKAMEEHMQHIERAINERVQPKAPNETSTP